MVRLVSITRVSEFISKLFLTKYQRALVSSFKQYKMDDLKEKEVENDPSRLLGGTTIQNYSSDTFEIRNEEQLTIEH